jgi:cytochrome c-type biogenesis protein CcmH/NrfG
MATSSRTVSSNANWTSTQAYIMAVITLAIGVAGGWLIRGSQPQSTVPSATSATTQPTDMGQQMPAPEQLKHIADAQVEPLVAKLKMSPNDPALLANLGNVYYDAQQYQDAIDYYQRSLKIQPENTNVRTDLATAWWYLGNADTAISEFNKVLSYDPNKANALLNLGVVKWQGKMDVKGAVAAWEELLRTNPNYENKEKVQQLIEEAKKHSNLAPGQQAKAVTP